MNTVTDSLCNEIGMHPEFTILLAEDSSDDVLVLRRALRKSNLPHNLQVVADGELAIRYLQGSEPFRDRECYPLPQLILLDLKMPRTDGFAVLEWMRRHGMLEVVPAVILSSSDQPKDVDQATRLGAKAYLLKPPTVERISAVFQMVRPSS
jgi:CheY-like chemotaxis protein